MASPSLNGKAPLSTSTSSSSSSIPSSSSSSLSSSSSPASTSSATDWNTKSNASSLKSQRMTRTTIANSSEDPRYNPEFPSSSFSPSAASSSSSSCVASDACEVEHFISSHADDLLSVLEEKKQRSEDIHLLEQNVRMVKEVFDDFEKTVNAQSPQLDMIESSTLKTEKHVRAAERELISAASYQRTGYVLASTAVGLLVGGPAGAAIGAKCALGVVGGGITIGLGGSLLGFGVGRGLQTMAAASVPTSDSDTHERKEERQPLTAASSSSSSSALSDIALTPLPSAFASASMDTAAAASTASSSSAACLPSSNSEGGASIAASLASYVPFGRLFSSADTKS